MKRTKGALTIEWKKTTSFELEVETSAQYVSASVYLAE